MMRGVIWLKRFATTVGVVAGLALGWAGYLRLTGNINVVEAGKLYRSGQLRGEKLKSLIVERKIKTVINLRGENVSQSWYDDEIAAVAATNASHINFGISANKELSDEQIDRLAIVLGNAEQPVLVHCEAGADRSGLAAAMYELLVLNRETGVAGAQLSFRYGHFPWLLSKTGAMDRTFERAQQRLAKPVR